MRPDHLKQAATAAAISSEGLTSIRSWLADQLEAHQYAKLGQGGHKSTQVPLQQVFVDLPTQESPDAHRDDHQLFLAHFLRAEPQDIRALFKVRRDGAKPIPTADEMEDSSGGVLTRKRTLRTKINSPYGASLLIGGPGQGKSTLGQLACQLHRAALLLPQEDQLTAQQRDLVRSLAKDSTSTKPSARSLEPKLPSKPLLPLQISLPELAAWAADTQAVRSTTTPRILSFIVQLPSAQACQLSANDLLAISVHLPILLVLDGFDEVGATEDRNRIVSMAVEFFQRMSQSSSQVQTLATTRPQGYANELERIGIPLTLRHLAPLTKDEALAYAEKLINAKIAGIDLQRKALRQIHEAAIEPSTERLLTTPLQVTILTALVQQLGRAPRERWNLFSRYFSYTYDREIERNTFASALLAEHRTHIERVHARVGLLLQVEAERAGGAAARMTRKRLSEVIEAVLSEDEVSTSSRSSLVTEIATAAENRLVFLVEPEPGRFGFEIRSLQEFMAAAALTAGRDSEVEARVLKVANASMFRNTTLFAASRFFSEGSPMRDILATSVCGSLDQAAADPISEFCRAGATLALEIIEEGAVLSQPKRLRSLMARAAGLLETPPSPEHIRLSRSVTSETETLFASLIEQRLKGIGSATKLNIVSVWVCLLDLASRGDEWARQLFDKHWPPQDCLPHLLEALQELQLPMNTWLAKRFESAAELIPFESLLALPRTMSRDDGGETWVTWLSTIFGPRGIWQARLATDVVPLKSSHRPKAHPEPGYPPPPLANWTAWIAAGRFELAPSKETLVDALQALAEGLTSLGLAVMQWRASWPLASALGAVDTPADLKLHIASLSSGKLGSIEEWLLAESKWPTAGRAISLTIHSGEQPWVLSTLELGPSVFATAHWALFEYARFGTQKKNRKQLLTEVAGAFDEAVSLSARQRLAQLCLLMWRESSPRKLRSSDQVKRWVAASRNCAALLVPRPASMPIDEWLDLINLCTDEPTSPWIIGSVSTMFDSLCEAPSNPVLLRLAVTLLELCAQHLPLDENISDQQCARASAAIDGASDLDERSQLNVALLQLYLGAHAQDDDATLFARLTANAESQSEWIEKLLIILQISKISRPRREQLLMSALSLPLGGSTARLALRRGRDALQRRTSDLGDRGTWDRLGLPLPYPEHPQQSLQGFIIGDPIQINAIEVRGLGPIERVTISPAPSSRELGQWTVILGPNGSGKTTLLRSMCLALRNSRNPAIWPKGTFARPWIHVNATDHQPSEAYVSVSLKTVGAFKTTIRPGSPVTLFQTPELSHLSVIPIFAYGCRRGSALGGAARQVNLVIDDGPEIATLFDDGADLIQAETWLITLEGDSSRNAHSRLLFGAISNALSRLLNVDAIVVEAMTLWVQERNGVRIPFKSLSDGYLTAAGWFLDLLARWLSLAESSDIRIDADFIAQMTGLVLIDEIDLHLHPSWQVQMLRTTRRLMPRMSFVVTTHNPLTLVGAKPEEIWILDRKDGEVRASQRNDAPMHLTGSEILRTYFSLTDIYPDPIGRALSRFAHLSGYAHRNDAEENEVFALRELLLSEGIETEWEIVERVANDTN